jgi:hypothetical protein
MGDPVPKMTTTSAVVFLKNFKDSPTESNKLSE